MKVPWHNRAVLVNFDMITASEAKKIVEATGVAVEEFLTGAVEPRVRSEAEKGNSFCFILVDAARAGQRVAPDEFQTRVINRLAELGYKVSFGRHGDCYVPAAYVGEMNAPSYTNYGYHINW